MAVTPGTVSFAMQTLFGSGIKTLSISWVGGSDGSVPSTIPPANIVQGMQGYDLGAAETVPGTVTLPENNYSITITDAYGLDLMGGMLKTRSNTAPQYVLPLLNGVIYGAIPVIGPISFNLSGNNVPSATGLCILILYWNRS